MMLHQSLLNRTKPIPSILISSIFIFFITGDDSGINQVVDVVDVNSDLDVVL